MKIVKMPPVNNQLIMRIKNLYQYDVVSDSLITHEIVKVTKKRIWMKSKEGDVKVIDKEIIGIEYHTSEAAAMNMQIKTSLAECMLTIHSRLKEVDELSDIAEDKQLNIFYF